MGGRPATGHRQCLRLPHAICVVIVLSGLILLGHLQSAYSAADAPDASPSAAEAGSRGTASGAPISPSQSGIDRLVREFLERNTKDKDVVEVGLAMKAADLLIGWVKIFGVFVAVPGAVLLTVLGWFGVSTFRDVREKRDQMNADLEEARRDVREKRDQTNADLEETRKTALRVDAAREDAEALVTKTSESLSSVELQLQRLQVLFSQNEQRIEALDVTVKNILEFAPEAKLSGATQKRMSENLDKFKTYFKSLGYQPSSAEDSSVIVRTDDPDHHIQRGLIAYYNPEINTMYINPDYSDSEYPALRQYAHRVLYASITLPNLSGAPDSTTRKWQGLEYGLADYFPASFRNELKLEAISTKSDPSKNLTVDLSDSASFKAVTTDQFMHRELAQQAWRATLWEIRGKIGREVADKCVYRAWCDL